MSLQQEHPKKKTSWARFSLKALLIIVTLLAIPCAYWSNLASQQRKTVAAFEGPEIKGEVKYAPRFKRVTVPEWLVQFLGRDYFFHVESAYVHIYVNKQKRERYHRQQDSELAIRCLSKFGGLQRLDIRLTVAPDLPVEKLDLGRLAKCRRLHQVEFTSPLDVHIREFHKLPALRHLTLRRCKVDKKLMASVTQCTSLEFLMLNECTLSGDRFVMLGEMPSLNRIELSQIKPVAVGASGQLDANGNRLPPFNFEAVPMTGYHQPSKSPSDFPAKQFEAWLDFVLPGVAVGGWDSML